MVMVLTREVSVMLTQNRGKDSCFHWVEETSEGVTEALKVHAENGQVLEGDTDGEVAGIVLEMGDAAIGVITRSLSARGKAARFIQGVCVSSGRRQAWQNMSVY